MPTMISLAPLCLACSICLGVIGVESGPLPVNNTCMDRSTVPPPGPKTFDCRGFVIESTDATWHPRSWSATEDAISKYFAEDWQSVRAFGTIINGSAGLRTFMKEWLAGFPDVYIMVSDLFCEGNDDVGYKTTMPYVLTATNVGPSVYGPATGRRVKYHGIANCYIKRIDGQWKYTTEWDVPDMWSFLMQLGVSIDAQQHPSADLMTLDECKPLFEWGTGKMNWFPSPSAAAAGKYRVYGPAVEQAPPSPKQVVGRFLEAGEVAGWSFRDVAEASRALGSYVSANFTYDFIYPVNRTQGLAEWFGKGGEMSVWSTGFPDGQFTKFLSAGDDESVTVAAYANANWTGHFLGLPPANKVVKVRDIDYYLIRDGKIVTNWCLIDVVDVLQQAGYDLLPPSLLPDRGYLLPNSMDMLPAPVEEFTSSADTPRARALVMRSLKEDFLGHSLDGPSWKADMEWYGPPGVGTASSRREYVEAFLKPLHAAFSRPELTVDVLTCQSRYCGAHAHFHGTHTGTWLGKAATGRRVSLRLGLHWRVDPQAGIAQGWCVIDLLSAFAQMGEDLLARAREQAVAKPSLLQV